jgi:uncharacterized protein YbgA (DUF1722 family)
VTIRTGVDLTGKMEEWAEGRLDELSGLDLCGYICKKDSPSSGMERVKVYGGDGIPARSGAGIFTRMFMERFPLIPVEEEGRLNDAKLRETFIEQIFTLKRWRETLAQGPAVKNLVDFHTRHKLLILSHSPAHSQLIGKLVAEAKKRPMKDVYTEYERLLIEALRLKTTLKKNLNVLQHILGYFKQQLSAAEKQEMIEILERYRSEYVPLIVPVTLMNHYVRKYDQPYLKQQVYLNPHPVALKLRNHA